MTSPAEPDKQKSHSPEERDRTVLELHNQLLEIEERLIPTGLHVFGRPSEVSERGDMLKMIASFDRPEAGARALQDLVSEGLGLGFYNEIVKAASADEIKARVRERIDEIVSNAVKAFVDSGANAAVDMLCERANVSDEQARPVFDLLEKVSLQLETNGEGEALLRALRGEYIEAGPGADIVQNPFVLPTGRNTHAVNPYNIPSPMAFARGEAVSNLLLARYLAEDGRYPRAVALVLWGLDDSKRHGEG